MSRIPTVESPDDPPAQTSNRQPHCHQCHHRIHRTAHEEGTPNHILRRGRRGEEDQRREGYAHHRQHESDPSTTFDFPVALGYTWWVDANKPIRLSRHADEPLWYRGTTEEEVAEAICTGPWQPAELNRMECRKTFLYGREWNGKVYSLKEVKPIFVEEVREIVVVTIYVYYR